MECVPGGDWFILGSDHANLCLAWRKPDYAWHNIPCVNVALVLSYCIRGYFRGGFICHKFASQSSRKFPLQYMAFHSNNSTKFMKFSHREFSHLVQSRENICTQSISSPQRQDLVTQVLVKMTFLYKLVAKKLDFVLSKLQISIWKDRATVAW